MEETRTTKRKLLKRAKERRCAKKRKGFGKYKVDVSGDLEQNIDYNFEADVNANIVGDDGDTPRNDPHADVPATSSSNKPGPSCVNLQHIPPAKSATHKQYRQLVNRSKLKLMNSVLHNENYFKAKTRLQRRKLGFLKDKQKVEAVEYKLMDVNLLKEVIAKSFICKFCKHAKGTINILEHMGGRKGLAECIIFICNYCSKEIVMYTSKKV